MRGVYTVAVLCELENCLGVELTNQFDVFVGTSVGGLLALGLNCGISCRVILETMKDSMERIFGNPVPWNPLVLRAAKHKADALRDCVERIFGENYNRNIVDLRKNVIVSSIDVDRNEIVYFSNFERMIDNMFKCELDRRRIGDHGRTNIFSSAYDIWAPVSGWRISE